ncbi:methyl-accepting chemotaxis protein [Vogesella urethralis]|uniref:methyl-accepting chemotaxis protein n=1 Tax=Vogesella urethralis TaxID=2592656 RepID=UPI001185CAC0|nr:methyl-accepting chemotaxis protein [Vogesella urethralis]MEC5206805.1 methyl-accepting chemotaxis protein [Vogesella perlucida]
MKLSTRLAILTAVSLFGLLLLGGMSLYFKKQDLLHEKELQITQLLQIAENIVARNAQLVQEGKLSEAEAKKQALTALGHVATKEMYYFVRDSGNVMLYHPKTSRIGKYDDGGKGPDGRTSVEVYAEALSKAQYGLVYVVAARPGSDVDIPKLNGVVRAQPWGWVIGTGFFVDDIDEAFWHAARLMLAFVIIGVAAVAVLAWLLSRSILRSLGGDPAYAAGVVRRIADGDLTEQIDVNGPEHSLLGSMRTMQHKLVQIIGEIRQGSHDIADAGNQLKQHMGHLQSVSHNASESTSSAAAAIEQLSVSIDHVTASARDNENDAVHTVEEAASGSTLTAEASRHIELIASQVGEVNTQVQSLSERTRNISGIAETIREIANQTNLLALNAAIEAARAGETGRGFAVVADEVRKLAERTALATDEIGTIVQAVVADTGTVSGQVQSIAPVVEQGVARVQEASSALQTINHRAQDSLSRIRSVAQAMAEQSKAGTSIAGSVEQVAGVVEDALSSARHAVHEVDAIHQQAEALRAAVNRFRT